MFTCKKRSRNIMSAALATSSISREIAMIMTIIGETRMLQWGVKFLSWIRLKNAGKLRSGPMAKATRDEEKIVVFSADMVEMSPPISIITPPPAKKCRATPTRAVSF